MQWVVEDCLALDSNRLAKLDIFTEGRRTSINWGGKSNITVAYAGGTLELLYNLNGEPNNQSTRITQAPCHFGGHRYYLHCPGCSRRGYKLYLAHSGFYCRKCYRLPYYSQECGYLDGLIRQKNKVEAKLENQKGPRIRTTTRMKLIDQLCALEDRIDLEFLNRLGPMVKKFGIG